MKLVAVTYGTEGDARPIAMLCRTLMDAGHEVTMLADAGTLETARVLGVPHAALSGDIRGALQPDMGIASVVSKTSLNATARALARIANENASVWLRQIVDVASDCDALLVSGLAAFAGLSAAEYLRIPIVGMGMFPITPTMAFPSPFLTSRIVPRWLNRASHQFVNAMLWRAFRKAINVARVDVCGLPPRRSNWVGHPMLYGVSPSLLPQPADWPLNAHMCGQWLRPISEWQPPQVLEGFLSTGDAPIYIGFGSMVGFNRSALLNALVAAVAGRRALFYPGWSGNEGLGLPTNFHVIGETPHDWLFPRTSLVIHHGGSGTTHSAARSGVPSLVLPLAGDQFFWAECLIRRGVSPALPGGKNANASALARAIDETQAAKIRDRAAALGAQMREEDGLAVAVEKIQKILC